MLAERIIRIVGTLMLMLSLVGAVSADEISLNNLRHGRWQVETPLGSAVGPCLYVEDVGDTDNPGAEGDVFALQTKRVALAVDPLVVV